MDCDVVKRRCRSNKNERKIFANLPRLPRCIIIIIRKKQVENILDQDFSASALLIFEAG
jgi:hypothetical protein